jgi:NADH-quinone oxidoreductase subunit I
MKHWWYRFYYTTRGVLWPLWVGLVNLFRRPVTIQYPHEKPRLFPRSRMMLYNDIDNCIGCLQCARVCPVDCIAIETVKADRDLGVTNTGHKKKLYVTVFDIDEAKCCYCNLCTEVCPTECLVMTPNFEGSVYDRYHLVLRFAKITPEERAEILRKAGGKTAGVTGILARKV